MKIHAIQTGTVRVKASQRVGRGRGSMRQVNILLDRSWTEPLPIFAWAIEAPGGVILVDVGETSRTREPGYFPRWHPYFQMAVQFDVRPEQEAGPQLRALGIRPEDVRTVILTHLHTDHAGGLHHFPKSEILVSGEELRLASGVRGRIRGYLPNRWPSWFAPKVIEFAAGSLEPFARHQAVTADGSVVIVPTPGHTSGHVSVIVVDDGISYFLAGDTTYSQECLLEGRVDGVSPDDAVSAETMRAIVRYARDRRTVYLPAHDPASGDRLASSMTIPQLDGLDV